MDETSTGTRSVVVEREIPHPPEKIWRALTQPHLIAEWLAKMDFKPIMGHRFNVQIEPQPGRSFVFDCEVIAVEPHRVLSYQWNSTGDGADKGLRSAVTWRLTPIPGEHICAWNSRGSSRISRSTTTAHVWVGRSSSQIWSRSSLAGIEV